MARLLLRVFWIPLSELLIQPFHLSFVGVCIYLFDSFSRDATEDDLKLWLPLPEKQSDNSSQLDLGVEMAVYLLTHVGDQFCRMVQTEKEVKCKALASVMEDGAPLKVAWKRTVEGVRETCDVCETTLFNFHWACGECGYVVCIDCHMTPRAAKSPQSGKDDEKVVYDHSIPFLLNTNVYNVYFHLSRRKAKTSTLTAVCCALVTPVTIQIN